MCQAFEGEKAGLFAFERRQRQKKWEEHKSGTSPLTDDELRLLIVDEIMARDAGY